MLRLVRRVRGAIEWQKEGGAEGLPRRPAATGAGTGTAAADRLPLPRAGEGRGEGLATAPAPPPPATAISYGDPIGAAGLVVIREHLGDCHRCKLHAGRKQIVFGVGKADAALVFVGEAPGADEDRTGEPFVGAAGQLLTRMIAAMGFPREEVYIANIIKCRPPGNRNPEPDEIQQCEPFLKRQLGAIRPRLIVALGKFAAQTLLRSDAPISTLRGRFHIYEGVPLMPTFHPAYLLRQPDAKRLVWDDLKVVMAELDRLGIDRRRGA
ncbi:MAG: uracil-DNA glycosylase [Myxococcales bacterium]|nr:uracil-DNA glycosylase [Myxococcales bacterium]